LAKNKNETIELDCPQCAELLEVDAGFAGGVCRCWTCGTLMTVPKNPSQEKAEALTRRDRPDAPGEGSSSERAEAPKAEGRSAGRAEAPPSDSASGSTAAAESEVFTTESGRTVQVKTGKIATARKRRTGVRATVVAVFVLVVGGIVVASIAGIVALMNMPAGEADESVDIEAIKAAERAELGYDPQVNPFLLDEPNYLGLSLRSPVAVTIDSSFGTRDWLDLAKEAAVLGLAPGGEGIEAQVIYWTHADPAVYPAEPEADLAGDEQALRRFLDSHGPQGKAEPGPALQAAMRHEPAHLVLVTGSSFDPQSIGSMSEAISEDPGTRVDAVFIGGRIPDELEQWVQKRGGRAIRISTRRLQDWFSEYLNARYEQGP